MTQIDKYGTNWAGAFWCSFDFPHPPEKTGFTTKESLDPLHAATFQRILTLVGRPFQLENRRETTLGCCAGPLLEWFKHHLVRKPGARKRQ